MDTKPTLTLFSGLPGSGKTTLARQLATHLGATLLAKDRIQRALRDHVGGELSGEAVYHLMLDLAEEQLALGVSVILDAVFPLQGFRDRAHSIASHHAARFRSVYCYCSDIATWQARMEQRVQYVPGWTPVGWDDVVRLQAIFQPWPRSDTLFLDALNPVSENLASIMSYLAD